MRKKAVVLISGGMDSAVCAAIAKDMGYNAAALHLNYGQRTQSREKKAFADLVKFFGIKEIFDVDVSYFSQIGSSSLTDNRMEIRSRKSEFNGSITNSTLEEEIPNTYVPFRNGNVLAIAASWAESISANAIFIGAMQLDYSGYPDCRQEFFDAFEQAINLGTKPDTCIKIITPIINYTKKDVVLKGMELGVPFELTWSCYKDEDLACGECDSCILRLNGFNQAGIKDPITYK